MAFFYYPGPRGFLWYFSVWESCERAAKQWTQFAKQQERKTPGYFGFEAHFHGDMLESQKIIVNESNWGSAKVVAKIT